MKKFLKLTFLTYLVVSNTAQGALNCDDIKQLVNKYYLKMHFSYSEFTPELSRRTLDNFIKYWDPSKLYFLKSDIDRFEQSYAKNIAEFINNNDCSFINDIMTVYSKRFEERQGPIQEWIQASHDFKVDEYIETDRKKISYAENADELKDRWRKRVKYQILKLKDTVKDPAKLKEKIQKSYATAKKSQDKLKTDDYYAALLNAFASGLDPHSDYMSTDQLQDFRISTSLSLEGIGAVLRNEDGFTTIHSLVPGGAAALTGKIKKNDKIIAVAQGDKPPVDVIEMDLRDVVKMIRGPRGSEVRLTILREEGNSKPQPQVVSVIREKVQLKDRAASGKRVVEVKLAGQGGVKKIGVLSLPSFYRDFEGQQSGKKNFKSASADVLEELAKLKAKHIDGLVIDLRSNGGGSLDESINIAGHFIDHGPVVQIRGPDGNTFVQSDRVHGTIYNGPLTVLINRQSASASEIFAGAVQDYDRGIIIGDTHSFGKGTVQNLQDVDNLGAVKVTISKFYRPSGSSTQLRGVEANIVLPDLFDELEFGEKYYDYALPWEQIKPASFTGVNMTSKYLSDLKNASVARIANDAQFKEIAEDIKKYRETEKEKSRLSLKEKSEAADKTAQNKKKKGKEMDMDGTEDMSELPLADDPFLQESVRITADYVQALQGKPLLAMEILGLKKNEGKDAKKLMSDTSPKKENKKGKVKPGEGN